MSQSSSRPVPRAVLFDAYGTLFDVYSIGVAAERLFPGAGERLATLWRDKQIEYTRLCSMTGSRAASPTARAPGCVTARAGSTCRSTPRANGP